MKNRTEKDKITNCRAFCGKEIGDYATCLQDAVHILLPKYMK
jgi:hypothetical protein